MHEAFATHCPSTIHRPPSPPPPFRFLDLPPEVRTHIASYILISHAPITIHEPRFNRHPRRKPSLRRSPPPIPTPSPSPPPPAEDPAVGHTRLALLLTCRLLYRENIKKYYASNTFSFALSTLTLFLAAIPARSRDAIRRLCFRMPYKHRHDGIWHLLSTMARLEELELWLHPATMARHSEWESCEWGSRECERLRVLRVRREKDERGESDEGVEEKDREVEAKVNAFLEERMRIRERGKEAVRKKGLFTPEASDSGEEPDA